MNNTVMKDVAKAENAFTSDETMRYKYMLRHHLEPGSIAQILHCPIEKVERIAKECQL